ncbi:MAG: permease [Gammaproteobacteria bacterium]|nr:permease [Gammaproteobacteria bacterium]MDH3447931.1 permease [Gammaproteobacteria bacterium]
MNTLTSIENRQGQLLTLAGKIAKDRVFQVMLLSIVLIGLIDSPQMQVSIVSTLESAWEMLPFFAIAIGIAAFAKATGSDALIAKAFSGHPVRATVLAALVGAFSPFCSCGVIPLIAAMLGAGVPLAPVMAFWIASPIMDPEMFVLTAAGIGFGFALAKTIAAMAMGSFAGLSILLIQRYGGLESPLRAEVTSCSANSCATSEPQRVLWKFWREPSRVGVFKTESASIGIFLGKWLTFAFFLESLMLAYLSPDWIAAYVGADNAFAIPLAAFVGAPSYLNGYAAIPLVSGLIEIGMTPGAAMAFVTAGAVSSIPAAIAVWALVKKRVFLLYLGLGLVGAMTSGWIYQLTGGVI